VELRYPSSIGTTQRRTFTSDAGPNSIRINDKWRICLSGNDASGPVNVEIVGYY
jgi:plasmid maintenance system killer protein